MKLSDIRKLCDAATPGPWSAVCLHGCGPYPGGGEPYPKVRRVIGPAKLQEVVLSASDADFIVAARTLVPELAAENGRLKGENEHLSRENAEYLKYADRLWRGAPLIASLRAQNKKLRAVAEAAEERITGAIDMGANPEYFRDFFEAIAALEDV